MSSLLHAVSDSRTRREQTEGKEMRGAGDQDTAPKNARNRQCGRNQRHALRITAEFQGIVAKAESVVVNGDELVVTIDAAVTLSKGRSAYDESHAQITALVFSEHPLFQSIQRVRAFLNDSDGSSVEVPVDILAARRVVNELTLSRPNGALSKELIPAPLVRFLYKQSKLRR